MSEFKYVPVEPTEEMLAATSWPNCAGTDYRHMIAAAPTQPSPKSSDKARGLLYEAFFALMGSEDSSKHNVSLIKDIKTYLDQPSPDESDKEAVRNAALEQAASACTNTQLMNIDSYCAGTASMCADRIRAMKADREGS